MIEISNFRNYREVGADYLLSPCKLAEVTVKKTTRKLLFFKKVEFKTKTIISGMGLSYWSFVGGEDEPIDKAIELEHAYKTKEKS